MCRQLAASYLAALRARRCPSSWQHRPVLTQDISPRVEQKAPSMLFVRLCSTIIFYVNAEAPFLSEANVLSPR